MTQECSESVGSEAALLEADGRHARARPQTFQVVEAAVLFREEMHDDGAEIDEHPTGVGVALASKGLRALVGQLFLEGIDQRVHMTAVLSRGNDEEVGKRGDLAYIE